MNIQSTEYKIPQFMLSALMYGDYTCLDELETAVLNAFLQQVDEDCRKDGVHHYHWGCENSDDSSFGLSDVYGVLACDYVLVDLVCFYEES